MASLTMAVAEELGIPSIAINEIQLWWKVVWVRWQRNVNGKIKKYCRLISKKKVQKRVTIDPGLEFEKALQLPELEGVSIAQVEFASGVRSKLVRAIALTANEATRETLGAILQSPQFRQARYWLDARDQAGSPDSDRIKADVRARSRQMLGTAPVDGRWADGTIASKGFLPGVPNWICKSKAGDYEVWHVVPLTQEAIDEAAIDLGF